MASTSIFAVGAALLCALTLGACARPVGDFGRAEADPIHDSAMPLIGRARAFNQKEPVSDFNLTDEEQEMRDRVWHYLVSPDAFDWFGDNIAELRRTRIAPLGSKPMRTDLYYGWLHNQQFASSHTRYSRVGDNVQNDIALMPDVFKSICTVVRIDRQRGIASNQLNLEAKMSSNAAARFDENQMVVGWFVRAARNRYDSYDYALNHLLVETPHEEAVKANDLMNQLAMYVTQAEAGNFCSGVLGIDTGRDPAIRSRYLIDSNRPVRGS